MKKNVSNKNNYFFLAIFISALLMSAFILSLKVGDYARYIGENALKVNKYHDLYQAFTNNNKSQKTLILLANNAEIRLGGGFIGTVGVISSDKGKLSLEPLVGVYSIDSGKNCDTKTYSQAEYLKVLSPCPSLRDSSNSLDFATNAEEALYFYQLNTGTSVDNVVQITPEVLERMLEKLGPVYLKEYNLEVTKDNFRDAVQLEVEAGKDKQAKKDPKSGVLGSLSNQLITRLLNERAINIKEYLSLVEDMVKEKQLVMYSQSTKTEELIKAIGASGSLNKADENYFMFAEANFSAKKNSPFIKNEVNMHQTIQEDGSSLVDVVIKTKHTSDFRIPYVDPNSNQSTWLVAEDDSFVSIALPENSKVSSVDGVASSKTTELDNHTVVSYVRKINPLGEITVSFSYSVPTKYIFNDKLVINTFVQKQIGGWPYTLNYSLSMYDDSYKLVASSEKQLFEPVGTKDSVVYTGEVNNDKILSFIYEKTK